MLVPRDIRGGAVPSYSTIKTTAPLFPHGGGGSTTLSEQSFATQTVAGVPVWALALGGLALAGVGYYYFAKR
jgi:hypothetical protein